MRSLFLCLLLLCGLRAEDTVSPSGMLPTGGGILPNHLGLAPAGLSNGANLADTITNAASFNDLANPTAFPQTFTRATSSYDPIANTITAPGVLRTRNVYVGSHTYSASLIEGPRTNLLAAGSSEFQSGWTVTRSSLSAGQWTAPDGESAYKLVEDATASNTHMAFQSVSITTTLPYTLSVYAKASTRSVIVLQFGATAFSTTPTAWFDLSAGSVSKTTGSPTSTSITPIGGGVYRCTMTATSTATAANNNFIYLDSSPTGSAVYSGDGVSGAFIWGADLQQAAFPTTYVSNRNLLVHSSVINGVGWSSGTGSAIASTGLADPLGSGLTVYSLKDSDTTTTQRYITQTCAAKAASILSYTLSFYVKADGWTTGGVYVDDGTNYATLQFDTVGMTTTPGTIGSGFTVTSSSITNFGVAGWKKVVATVQSTTSTTLAVFIFNKGTATYTGVVGNGLDIADIQLEPGTTATAYWGTNATVGGRDADALSISLAALPGGGLNTTAGTLVPFIIPNGWSGDQDGATVWEVCRVEGTTTTIGRGSATLLNFERASGGADAVTQIAHGLTSGVLKTVALTWDGSGSSNGYVNGVAGTAVTARTTPWAAATQITIGNNTTNGNRYLYGWVWLGYWHNTALTASDQLTLAQGSHL